jgi:hypothetical protein
MSSTLSCPKPKQEENNDLRKQLENASQENQRLANQLERFAHTMTRRPATSAGTAAAAAAAAASATSATAGATTATTGTTTTTSGSTSSGAPSNTACMMMLLMLCFSARSQDTFRTVMGGQDELELASAVKIEPDCALALDRPADIAAMFESQQPSAKKFARAFSLEKPVVLKNLLETTGLSQVRVCGVC